MAYFGDASLHEELMLKRYDAIVSRVDEIAGD